MVTGQQPSSERDTVGLIVKLFRINLIKGIQLGIFQDFRMDRCHTVYREPVMDVDMRHMHPVILINDLHLGILILLRHTLIQLFNDRHQLRHYLLQILKRPFLQCLRQNGVVRISTGPAHHVDGLIHGKRLIVYKNPDQLRDHHRRMGIIDLDHRMIIQSAQVILLFLHLF